jgi:hypothetical protein
VFHDVNVYPTRTTLDEEGNVTLAPDASSIVAKDPLPPFATKLTVIADVDADVELGGGVEGEEGGDEGEVEPEATGVHCAYSVSLEETSSDCPGPYSVPKPSGSVFHPVKV